MAFELVIVVVMGFAGAGTFALLARLLRLKNTKRIIPLVAAASMLTYQVWSRYSWADRAIEGLPAGSEALATYPKTSLLEPWTFAWPMAGTLLVLDGAATMTHAANPGVVIVTTRLYEQHADTLSIRHMVDCTKKRRLVMTPDMALDDKGMPPETAAWIDDGQPPELFRAACRG